MTRYDVIVVGGGIIGLATALQLLTQHSNLKLLVLEKEAQIARHQTGHNSGVIHSGIYYRPGSLKAKNCRQGVNDLQQYCDKKGIPYDLCGKVIVATRKDELGRLDDLFHRAQANAVPDVRMIDASELKEIEPHCSGIRALYSPKTGIIDYTGVSHAYANDIISLGGEIICGQAVTNVEPHRVHTQKGSYQCKCLVNCAGIQADRLTRELRPDFRERILPFRGEYYDIRPDRRHLVKGLIYPVPDPEFPFLGVHLSKTVSGKVEAGPNAVLAWSRNGYRKGSFNLADAWETLSYSGFWAMARRYWKVGLSEMRRSFSKQAFLESLQRFVPALTLDDLVDGSAGVRSQVIGRDGGMVDDFLIQEEEHAIHVVNAPSPGATASLAIGSTIAKKAASRLRI